MFLILKLLKKLILSPDVKGAIGEHRLETSLNFLDFWGYNGHCLRNVYVPRSDGTTSEIDLIYITKKGLFVIESKNYIGYIFGNEHWNMWTSTVYAGKSWLGFKKVEKNKFYNPIWQNKGHISSLRHYCGNIEAFSIIAFSNNCEFKDITWDSPNTWVCYYSELKQTIKKIWRSVPDLYDDATLDRIYANLLSLENNKETRARHIDQIYNASAPNVCPRCGGTLVLRQAKKGKYVGKSFYGCSNYPRCNYIKNI